MKEIRTQTVSLRSTDRSKIKSVICHPPSPSGLWRTSLSAICIIAMMAVIVLVLMHGMVSEVELRELKRDRMAYNMILTDRALLERQADKAAHSSKHKSSKQLPSATSYKLQAGARCAP